MWSPARSLFALKRFCWLKAVNHEFVQSGDKMNRMSRPQRTIYNGAAFRFLTRACLAVLLLVTALRTADAQEKRPGVLWLLRLDGIVSSELAAKIDSPDQLETPGFALSNARLENDSMGAFSRVRSRLTVTNLDDTRRISGVEWRLDIYDEALRSLTRSVIQTDEVRIYPGETATATANFGAVLPDRMIVLVQVVKVSFAEGPAWSASVDCTVGDDLRTVSCKAK